MSVCVNVCACVFLLASPHSLHNSRQGVGGWGVVGGWAM